MSETERQRHSFAEQKDAAERELRMRRSVYPRWVAAKKMTQTKADREIRLMEDICHTLGRLSGGGLAL